MSFLIGYEVLRQQNHKMKQEARFYVDNSSNIPRFDKILIVKPR